MATTFPPLAVTDLLAWAVSHRSFSLYGRANELQHLARLIRRQEHNNIVIVGKRGIGKSAITMGFAGLLADQFFPGMQSLPCISLDTDQISKLLQDEARVLAAIDYVTTAFTHLPPAIVIIDDCEKILTFLRESCYFEQLFNLFITSSKHRLLLVAEEEQWEQFRSQYQHYLKTFEVIKIKELPENYCQDVIRDRGSRLATQYGVQITEEALQAVGEFGRQLPSPRAMPDRALRFFDEVCASCQLQKKARVVREDVEYIFSQRQGIPTTRLSRINLSHLQAIEQTLARQVIGQPVATQVVASVLKRGWLGLKNPKRPIGSLLFLGPSGVGKTEMAKVIAREMYGSDQALVRLDMSEFAESHTVQRLVGAPPGYIGYEAGGQLTNPIIQQPFSLILLDEIEKAHPAIFDVFLQVLDDGRLTDGQGQTVDFSKTVIVATSNIGIQAIVAGWQRRQDVTQPDFYTQSLLPLLTQRFRLEFLNRFEAVTVFQPLSPQALRQVAALEIEKIQERFKHHHVSINLAANWLEQTIQQCSDPRFGARPLKRAIEEACESLLAEHLLKQPSL